ncbi:MAG: sulfatase [Planctomycetales bacterium]|nr:sulfatase [Planctomycetales bacterium]
MCNSLLKNTAPAIEIPLALTSHAVARDRTGAFQRLVKSCRVVNRSRVVRIALITRFALFASVLCSAQLAAPATGAERSGPSNVLLICVDDLRPELRCYGREYIHSPNIDRLAAQGRLFRRHYVQAPTCGASRFTLLTGRYGGAGNGALFDRSTRLQAKPESVPASMPAWFRQHGFTTVSVGKVSHHPGGRGGPDWNDDSKPEMPDSWDRHLLPAGPWQHPRGWMHGLANGEIRTNVGEMDVFQSVDGDDMTYPDGVSMAEALRQLATLASADRPFFLAVGILRPHLPFGAPAKYMAQYRDAELPAIEHPAKPAGRTTWHGSGEFMKYNRWKRNPNNDAEFATEVRKHYAACVSYADAQVGRLLAALEKSGAADNTIVVLWGDHGWHLGEHAIWGKHALFEESLRSPLIISYRGLKQPGVSANGVVETLDLFPTLCELTGVPRAEFAQGVSLAPILADPAAAGHVAISYQARAETIRTDTHRLIAHKDGYHELYDHRSPAGETANVAAQHPDLVEQLEKQLRHRLRANR